MAAPPDFKKPATYDDLRRVPDPMVAEILDGELYATPRPALRHAHATTALSGEIRGPFDAGRGGPGGWWILYEPELHLGRNVIVPDLAGWRRDRVAAIPDAPAMTVAPDWACEVLSPSTEAIDRGKKLSIYARERVPHVWLVNPSTETLEAYTLADGARSLSVTHAGRTMVCVQPFDAIELDLAALWVST